MHSMRLWQSLVVAIALSLMLLIAGVIGLGVGIRHGDVVPPDLNVSLSGLHIVGFTTGPYDCRPNLPCPSPTRDYYVVWVLRKTAPDYLSETGRRILTMPLKR